MSINKPLFLLVIVVSAFLFFQVFTFFGLNQRLLNLTTEKKWESLQEKEEHIVISNDIIEHNQNSQNAIQTSEMSNPGEMKNSQQIIKESELISSRTLHYPGDKKTALVIVAYNRPQYLERTFESIIATLSSPTNNVLVDIVLSQDGYLTILDDVVKNATSQIQSLLPTFRFMHLHHEQVNKPGDSGYHKLARHFGWFLDEMFKHYQYEQVIILEDDLEIAPDFFEYFDATSPLLWKDPSIYCVSAWNDNGQAGHVSDPERLFRSDFFPGLGWMLTKNLWDEIGTLWPEAYWDDWLRHPDRRHDRVCIRPEISRSYTFGEKGTSNSQFFGQYLKGIQKNDQFVPFTKMNLDFLLKNQFDTYWRETIDRAIVITDLQDLPVNSPESFKIYYDNKRGRVPFLRLAMQLHIMQDEKAGVYRTAYMGVVSVRHQGTQLYIVPRNGPSFDYAMIH